MRITVTDIQQAGHCAVGIRRWFNEHGLNFRSFLKDGIDAAVLLDTGDALAQRVVDLKIKREARRG